MFNNSIKTQIPEIPDYDSSKTKRCLFKTNEGDYYDNINNAELQEKDGEIPKDIKCICNGCAKSVNDCLADVITILAKFDPMASEYTDKVMFRFKNHDNHLTYGMQGEKKIKQILESKAKCAIKGIDYLAGIENKKKVTYFGQPSC